MRKQFKFVNRFTKWRNILQYIICHHITRLSQLEVIRWIRYPKVINNNLAIREKKGTHHSTADQSYYRSKSKGQMNEKKTAKK